ncbi:hypothetical protein CsSME_00050295 [Camellia sinensis var. sinensis]
MDLWSLLLYVLITCTLFQALISLAKPSKNSPGKLPPDRHLCHSSETFSN